jgi:hypothetical protein
MKLVKVNRNTSTSNYWVVYDKQDLDEFVKNINYTTTPLNKTETLYIEGKGISQDKIRAAGFKITRNKANADLIVIGNIFPSPKNHYDQVTRYYTPDNADIVDENMDIYIAEELLGYKYVDKKVIYPYLYKYAGDKAMFDSISELFSSNDVNNAKIAMEYMANANWEGNEIYLQEIFNLYYNSNIHDNSYRTSISFKGFLETLEFSYRYPGLRTGNDYRDLCLTDEHHEWVNKKYDSLFKSELKTLLTKYKLKLKALEIEIDYTKKTEDDE